MPNLHDPFMQFLVNNALVIVFGIITTILAAWAIIQARSKKELSYEIVSQAPVVSVNEKMANRVKILLDGNEIKSPYLTVIKFTNSGNRAITENDFVDPITIDFKGSQIVSAEILETKPEKYFAKPQDKADFIQWKGPEATLRKKFLNPANQIVISTLIEQKVHEIKIYGVIAEGRLKQKSEPSPYFEPFMLLLSVATFITFNALSINKIVIINSNVTGILEVFLMVISSFAIIFCLVRFRRYIKRVDI